ncbi:hypothetical protein EJ377_17070 [Chryseobacterium arthrosphaerae]|uniref:Uncharacterized protein n=1 Tax=Chryseobacterium arthrosphaerae TaxID=651561 RepID=A0A3S0Q445_9FLAO|nr:hypothetical protein EJ377_17070 [Chryseobacterium arthrosphaerae]
MNKDILNAQEEVLIISPYIDESKVDDLLMLKNREVKVRLAFSDLRPEQYEDVLRKLIHQHKVTDVKKKEKRESLKSMYFLAAIALLCLGLFRWPISVFISLMTSSVPIIFCTPDFYHLTLWVLPMLGKKTEVEKMEIYKYHYSET